MADAAPLAYAGACYGWALRSNQPLVYARAGGGDPLDVVVTPVEPAAADAEPVMTFHSPTPDRVVTGHVYAEGERRYRAWVDGGGWYVVDAAAGRVEAPADAAPVAREEALWSVPGRILLVERGDLPLHAAAVEVAGRALVVTGPTRHGKTTLAASLAAAGFRLLSEDLVDISFPGGSGAPVVVPGPAYLRLRSDMSDVVRVPGATVVAESTARRHLAVGERGTCDPLPVAAVVLLRLSDGEISVGEPDEVEAIRDVWSQGFALPTAQSRAQSFHNVGRLVSSVPVLDLARPLRMDVMPRVVDTLVDLAVAHV
jgi:hypothetical protein